MDADGTQRTADGERLAVGGRWGGGGGAGDRARRLAAVDGVRRQRGRGHRKRVVRAAETERKVPRLKRSQVSCRSLQARAATDGLQADETAAASPQRAFRKARRRGRAAKVFRA